MLLQVRPVAEDEMFKVLKSGKRGKKSWKRMITKVGVAAAGAVSLYSSMHVDTYGLICAGAYKCMLQACIISYNARGWGWF